MHSNNSDKPSYEEYADWYKETFAEDLLDGSAEKWYDEVTHAGVAKLEQSDFWTRLHTHLPAWNASFVAEHEGYPLFGSTPQPTEIDTKTFESVLNKSFRWNVLENSKWPAPPERIRITEPDSEDPYSDDPRVWSGPHNWLKLFPDIFRARLTTTYFDGVGYLAERVMEVAKQTSPGPPELQLLASHDGYHAAHLAIHHELDILDYEHSDPVCVRAQLEIQVTTTIQATISKMLHSVYEEWRLKGRPQNWEWDHSSPAFSVNYLGSTLHYLEGMIVMARDQKRSI